MSAAQSTTGSVKPFIITRTFDAPRDVMVKAWTEQDRFIQWFGPKGFKMAFVKCDMRTGGMLHYNMTTPDGSKMWGKALYREISPPDRLVWINAFSDEKGGTAQHPMMKDWPLEMLTTVTFEAVGNQTLVTVRWEPVNPTPAERKAFDENHASMTMGWGGTFERLEAYLATA